MYGLVDLGEQIRAYSPCNAQEAADQIAMLDFIKRNPDALFRSNMAAHFTASAWVTNPGRDRLLMAYHNLYDAWSWLGGHADGDADLLSVALREVREETGVQSAQPLLNSIFSLELLTVDGHRKGQSYVPSHLHLNLTYLLEANDSEALFFKPDENSAVRWFALHAAPEASTEPWMVQWIYKKLNEKLEALCEIDN